MSRSEMRLFFGHQSVGQDLIDGLTDEQAADSPRAVVDLDAEPNPGTPALLHARLGVNGAPRTKIDGFVDRVLGLYPDGLDVAMMKFCYADFGSGDDPDDLLARYRKAIDTLGACCPGLRIAHVTVPLRRIPLGLHALARRVFLRPEDVLRANARRDAYNKGLRAQFHNRDPIFDLAALEARRPGGGVAGRRYHGQWIPALAPEYTQDGGHLNQRGRQVLAPVFQEFLEALDDPTVGPGGAD